MSERYTRLYSLPENLYADGSPLIIAAGSLLKDNQTGNVLAQIKFKSITDKAIAALMVKIKAFDVTGKELKGVEEYQYLDLNVGRNQEFGQKSPIMLPENVTRSFECEVTAVIFSDDTSWKNSGVKWEALPKQELLKEKLGELNEQYLRDTECKGELCPSAHKDIWFCSCGGVNKKADEKCSACSAEKEKLFSALRIDLLTEHKKEYDRLREEERLKKEAEEKEQQIKAEARAKRNKKIAIITSGVVAACIAIVVLVNSVIIPNGKYKKAVALIDSGNTIEAYEILNSLDGYKDSEEKASSIIQDYFFQKFGSIKVGEYLTFGKYEQDCNTLNGKEEIEWLVLEKEDNRIFVISKYALDCKPYDEIKTEAVTWGNCTLRKWLNNDFFNTAFSEAEKTMIVTENATLGKVYLLGDNGADEYFKTDKERKCVPTAFAMAQGAFLHIDTESCLWWLRSTHKGKANGGFFFQSDDSTYASVVSIEGWVGDAKLDDDDIGVRPVLWISVE